MLALKSDLGRLVRFNEQRAGDPELAIARERGWRAYHVIKDFIYGTECRRRALLDHFSDSTAGAPLERCCDVCDMLDWLPDPETIAVRKSPRAAAKAAARARPLPRRRAALRGAENVAPAGRRRQARLHRRQQQNPDRDRRRAPAERGRPARDQRRRPRLHREVRTGSARIVAEHAAAASPPDSQSVSLGAVRTDPEDRKLVAASCRAGLTGNSLPPWSTRCPAR